MHVITDEDATMDNQVNTATQSSNVNVVGDSQSSVEILEEHRHQALVLTGSKRHQEFPVEDGLERLPKYPKLDTVQETFEPKEGQTASSSSDEFCDGSLDRENGNHNENVHHPVENLCSQSSEVDVQLNSENPAAELDSDADSVAISPQREIPNNVLLNRIKEKESHETIRQLLAHSKVLRVQSLTSLTSQFVSNNDLENNNITAVANFEATIKQSNSQPYNTSQDITDEPVNVISIPENSSLDETQDEYLQQEESDQTEASNNNGAAQQEDAASNYLYAAASQSSRRSNLKIECSSSQEQSSQSSQDIYQGHNESGESIRNQVYPSILLSQMMDNQVPSTSRGFEENALGLSMSSSVSDLSQLVESLKCDVQRLTERVDQHEVTLKAIVHGNPANLAFLFTPSFKEKYSLKIPFTKLEDLLKFNDDLSKDKNFCQEFITSLTGFIDTKVTFAKNILNMVKQYMSKEVAILFNASKPAPNKLVLKDYLFCRCLLQATQITIQGDKLPLEHEKAFYKNLGHVISGAKGWHNHNEE